jgi:6-pyruvoyltetrahydropterin/6-carboxytetrahydropterin synthase
MYELSVDDNFSAAHQLREYKGQCENLHGHTWRVQVVVRADKLDDTGLAIDFRDIKQALTPLIQTLDHTCLNELPVFAEQNPSSENIARWLYNELCQSPLFAKVKLQFVRVWESDTASAAYFEET